MKVKQTVQQNQDNEISPRKCMASRKMTIKLVREKYDKEATTLVNSQAEAWRAELHYSLKPTNNLMMHFYRPDASKMVLLIYQKSIQCQKVEYGIFEIHPT